jgi:hypothetical protein
VSLLFKERLREDSRDGTIVVIRIVNIVRVKLDLAIIEVEVRRLVEVAIGIRLLSLFIQVTRA